MLQHSQTSEASDIPAWQGGVWPLGEDYGHCQESDVHASCDLGDGSLLELSQVGRQRLQSFRESVNRFIACSSCCCKVGQVCHCPIGCTAEVAFDSESLIHGELTLSGVSTDCIEVLVSRKAERYHLCDCVRGKEGPSLIPFGETPLAS